MPDAELEPGSFSIFGDMRSQNFSLKKGTSDQIRLFTSLPDNGFNFKKGEFYVQNRSPRPKITPPPPPCQFQQF